VWAFAALRWSTGPTVAAHPTELRQHDLPFHSSHPWRGRFGSYEPRPTRPVWAFASLRWSTGPTVAAHPTELRRL